MMSKIGFKPLKISNTIEERQIDVIHRHKDGYDY